MNDSGSRWTPSSLSLAERLSLAATACRSTAAIAGSHSHSRQCKGRRGPGGWVSFLSGEESSALIVRDPRPDRSGLRPDGAVRSVAKDLLSLRVLEKAMAVLEVGQEIRLLTRGER